MVAKRYPMKKLPQILADLIATTPGAEGKWFASAKDLKLYDLALEFANRYPWDPVTLIRAARYYLDTQPAFARGAAMAALRWMSEGWGYEVTSYLSSSNYLKNFQRLILNTPIIGFFLPRPSMTNDFVQLWIHRLPSQLGLNTFGVRH